MTGTLRTLAHVVRADFLERVRRHGFYVTVAVTLWFAYVFLPPNGANYVTLELAGHRGAYGSAWVGALVAMLASSFLSLAGFYLVKDAVARDRATGVGQVLAATPLPKWLYTVGKATSNFAVLATMTLLLALGSGGMQWLRGEDRHLDPLALFAPFVVVTLPALACVAAVAVLFECVPKLRGGLGNVAWFFLWSAVVATGVGGARDRFVGVGDFLGTRAILPAMLHGVAAVAPGVDVVHAPFSLGINFLSHSRRLATFAWAGPEWNAHVLLGRAAWLAIGVAIAAAAALPFDRFDTPARPARAPRGRRGAPAPDATAAPAAAVTHSAADLPPVRRGTAWWSLARVEFRLLLAPMPWPWRVVAAALAIACALAPLGFARAWLLPFASIWPLLAWSPLGARDVQCRTEMLIDASPRPLVRPLAAAWLAGAAVAVAMGGGVGVRLLATGRTDAALAWLGGALLAPTAALACGTWTGNGRLFEIGFLLLWYIGPMNHLPPLDYAATQDAALAAGAPVRFALVTLALAVLAVAGRARRLRR